MMLLGLLFAPFLAGVISLLMGANKILPKACAVLGLLVAFGVLIALPQTLNFSEAKPDFWLIQWQSPWISAWGISFHLGLDGLAFWLIALTLLMGLIAVVVAKPTSKPGPYFAALLWAITGVVGIFLSADIFLFFIFWELALFPVYFMLVAHGHQAGFKAPLRFILFTQLSGLLLLISVVALAFAHYQSSGILTFDYQQLILGTLSVDVQFYLFFGFLLTFLIKMPAFPFHGWLVGVFMEMPLPALLVGILVKTAVFGLLRFSWVLFPAASLSMAFPMMILGVFGLIYGAILAFSQTEPKMVLAYATLSHVGLLLIGVFCHNQASYFGVVLLMICQALSSGGLMLLMDRISSFGDLWNRQTKFSAFLLAFVMASIGIPGFGNFVGEWLILSGSFAVNPLISILASTGIVFGALYSLRLFQKLAWQKGSHELMPSSDLIFWEFSVFGLILFFLIALGLYPGIIFEIINPQNFSSLQQNLPEITLQAALFGNK